MYFIQFDIRIRGNIFETESEKAAHGTMIQIRLHTFLRRYCNKNMHLMRDISCMLGAIIIGTVADIRQKLLVIGHE